MSDPGTMAAIGRSARIGTLLALSGAAAYGINIVAARVTAQAGITGPDMVVYRGLVFLPVVIAMALATGRRLTLLPSERGAVFRFALFSACTALSYMSSLKFLPVPIAVTIFYTYPLLVILLSPYTDGIRISPRRWVVAIAAFAGVLLAVGPHVDGLDPRGVALAFLGSLFCAGMFITASKLTSDGIVTFFWAQLVALPLALAFAYATGGLATPETILGAAWPFAITALGFFIGLLFQIMASARLSAASTGLLFLLEPVVAISVAALILHEHITPTQLCGMLIVIAALAYDMLPGLRPARTFPLSSLDTPNG